MIDTTKLSAKFIGTHCLRCACFHRDMPGVLGFVCGYHGDYIIVGYNWAEVGCVKQFSNHIVYDKSYTSYRMARPRNLII